MIERSHMYKTQIKDPNLIPARPPEPEPSLAEILQDYVRWVAAREPPPPAGADPNGPEQR